MVLAGVAAVMVALALAAILWLVQREEARWREFRRIQGEPDVVARAVAARAGWSKFIPLGWMVFGSATDRWESVIHLRRRRHWTGLEQEVGAPPRRQPGGSEIARRSRINRF